MKKFLIKSLKITVKNELYATEARITDAKKFHKKATFM